MTELSSSRAARCGALLLHSLTCQREQVAGMGLAAGKKSALSRTGGVAGSSAFDQGKMATNRFVICYLAAFCVGESVLAAGFRWFLSWPMAGPVAAADLGAAEIQEGGRGSGAVRVRSHLIHFKGEKIFTLPT